MMFALATLALLPLVGLAVDFAFIAQARAQLDTAADTAALTAAKTAGAAFVANVAGAPSPASQGQTAGAAWFTAQVGTIPDANLVSAPTVTVTPNNNSFTATVSYSANVDTVFHKIFGIQFVTISNTASAVIVANAYVDVSFLLDNSSSMLIAATSGTGGVATMEPLAANSSCFATADYNSTSKRGTPSCTGSGVCTQGATQIPGFTSSYNFNIGNLQGCRCAFACHWVPPTGATTFTQNGVNTESGAANTNNTTQTYSLDYYGLARANGVQLRFDVVQSAIATAIGVMQSNEVVTNQFGAAVFEFGNTLTQDWPPTTDTPAQAITDMANLTDCPSPCSFSAQAAAVAMRSPVTADSANTNFPAAMASLVTTSQAALTAAGLTKAGDGSTPTKAKRSLIIITDGIQDWGGRSIVAGYSLSAGISANPGGAEGPISLQDCAAMKSLGYTIYVLYTTYITSPPTVVLNNTALVPYVSGAGEPSADTGYDLIGNLQGCASNPANFAQASLPADITTALQSMVKAALAGGATLTH